MFTEKELELFIQLTKNRKKLDSLESVSEKSFVTVIKKLDSKSNIVDECFSVDVV